MSKYEKFKICILSMFVFGGLYCIYFYSCNGRYVFSNNREGAPFILDSRTGEIYSVSGRKKLSLENYKSIK